jgi:hypothetical protein
MRVDDGREFDLARLDLSIKIWSYSSRTLELIPRARCDDRHTLEGWQGR